MPERIIMAGTSVGPQERNFVVEHYAEKPHESGSGFYRWYKSPECWSGEGNRFSEWYSVTSAAPPDGFWVASANFELVGDRKCKGDEQHPSPPGDWCECKQAHFPGVHKNPSDRNQERVSWKFRMQGHNDVKHLKMTGCVFRRS